MLERPANPELGELLLTRVPRTDILTVIYPDGQSVSMLFGGRDKEGHVITYRQFINLGIPEGKAEKLIDYVYNFYQAYVALEEGVVIHSPPVPDNVPSERFRDPVYRDRMQKDSPA